MSNVYRNHGAFIKSFYAITAIALASIATRTAIAITPDIPRIQAGAVKGSPPEELELASAYLLGRGVERNEKLAAYWYEKAANSGDPVAQQQIGYLYTAGIGVDRNPARAVYWYERAVAGGLASAKVNLGVAYLRGAGVLKDEPLAAKLFQEAAAKGSGAGACYLGTLYYFGVGVPKDAFKAKRWFEIGSKLHDARAKHDLALVLLREQKHLSDERVAKLLRESAKAGFVPARHELGLFLLRNPAFAKSSREPIDILEEAAQQGFWKSSILLGIAARDGLGLPADPLAAYYHFRIAVLQGGDEAARLLAKDMEALSLRITKEAENKVDSEADDWFNKNKVSRDRQFELGEELAEFLALRQEFPGIGMSAGSLFTSPIKPGSGRAIRLIP